MQVLELGHKELLKTSSAMNVKLFVHKDPIEAEKAITAWLQQNNVLIHHIGQSQSEKGGAFVFTLSVFYSRLEE